MRIRRADKDTAGRKVKPKIRGAVEYFIIEDEYVLPPKGWVAAQFRAKCDGLVTDGVVAIIHPTYIHALVAAWNADRNSVWKYEAVDAPEVPQKKDVGKVKGRRRRTCEK